MLAVDHNSTTTIFNVTTTLAAATNGTGDEHTIFGLYGAEAIGLSSGMAVSCILGAGLASGLNLCLLSLDPDVIFADATNMELPESVRDNARKVHNILVHQHWMLVTTLVWNAVFAETNPLILESLLGGIAAIVISTLALVIFGEIIPQSCFTRYALSVAGFLSPVVWTMMIVSAPVSVPIAKLLDIVVGHRPPLAMKRVELRELIALNVMSDSLANAERNNNNRQQRGHQDRDGDAVRLLAGRSASNSSSTSAAGAGARGDDNNNKDACHPPPQVLSGTGTGQHVFTPDEVALLNSALNLSEKTVRDVMKPGELVGSLFMLEEKQVLTRDVVRQIADSNKTRIPVYRNDRRNITGFIFSHAILHILFMDEATQAPTVTDCGLTAAARCNSSDLVVVLFRPFLADAQDIAVVHDSDTGLPMGIVTKWDMLSFLFNEDIAAEKWSLQDAEALALEARATHSKRAKRETMVLARNAAVSSGLKLIESGLPLTALSSATSASVARLAVSPSSSSADLAQPSNNNSGRSKRSNSALWRRSGVGAAGALPRHQELRHSQQEGGAGGGGGHASMSYGTTGVAPGTITSSGSLHAAYGLHSNNNSGSERRSGRFRGSNAAGATGSLLQQPGARSSHFVAGDTKRRMPSFAVQGASAGASSPRDAAQ